MSITHLNGLRTSLWLRCTVMALAIALATGASGCRAPAASDEPLSGNVTLWHGWPVELQPTLEDALDGFEAIHPEVGVIDLGYPTASLLEEFEFAASAGIAPTLLLGSDVWVRSLADEGWIRPLTADGTTSLRLRGGAEAASEYLGESYGVPVSLSPSALYYNTALVETPPTDLNELLRQAEDGLGVAMVPRFKESYWGIQGFGSGLFDAAGDFTVAESGFAEWLEWLSDAQGEPGIILHEDVTRLSDLFIEGDVAYFVAGPERQSELIDAMGVDGVGVSPLPAGPVGPAGPLLPVETAYVYAFAAPEQQRVADALVRYLGNKQQSMRFMRELGRVPANADVRVDSRLYPTVAGFAKQAETAVVLPSEVLNESVYAAGNQAYASVLSGTATADEAVCAFAQEVARTQGYSEDKVTLPKGCDLDVRADRDD